MSAPAECGGSGGYRHLRDVSVGFNSGVVRGGGEGEGFALSFWLYLSNSARPSSVILHQVAAGDDNKLPFLALGEGNNLVLFPLLNVHREAPVPDTSYPWTDTTDISAIFACPLEKWFHIGCEVTENIMHLHIDGDLIAEAHLSSLSNEPDSQDGAGNLINLVGSDDKLEGYAYNIKVAYILGNIYRHFVKNPPYKLSIDYSSCDGIEEGDDGIWSIVGGKATCRQNFTVEVLLIDAFGEPVKDGEVVALLIYADNGTVVEKSRNDSEPPLLITCEGLEYPATSRPLPVIRGRALFKLKISQLHIHMTTGQQPLYIYDAPYSNKLSSKCDNKLFRIHFLTLHMQRYPFLEAYSKPIRCISRHRTIRSLGSGKRMTSATMGEMNTLSGRQGFATADKVNGCLNSHGQSSVGYFHSFKSVKIEDAVTMAETHKIASQNKHARKVVASKEAHNVMGTDSSASDSDSFGAGSSWSGSDGDEVGTISDAVIFRYCLDSTYDRSKFLRGAALTVNTDDLVKLADQIALYSGCSHHRNQILISKQLLQGGSDTWSMTSKNNERALWSSAIPEIITKFMAIANCTRVLSEQDQEVLRGIAGCGDDIGRNEFEMLWYWLYPVAASLSRDKIKNLWDCSSPRWIEG